MPSRPVEHKILGPDEIGGANAMVGYTIDLTPADGSARAVLEIEDRHRNRNGTLHGGIIAMMLDAAAGYAASRSSAEIGFTPVNTISLTTSFLKPATGGQVIATGQFVGGGYKIVYADAVLTDADGVPLAKAAGVFKRILKGADG